MLTDERIKQIEEMDKNEWLPYVEELIDEIKRLRAELALYKTPNVDNVDSERCCLERVKKARKR